VNVEDVLKIVSVVLIPSIGAVVWLLSQVYGLRSDLRQIQTLLETEKTQNADRIRRVEENVEKIANALHDLTIDLARLAGTQEEGLAEMKIPSWRTTTTGILAILVAVAGAFKAELDGDATTAADWGAVAAAIIAGIGLIAARDAKVSSQQEGIR